MAKYSLETLTSIFITKNARKTRDNLPESQRTLVPHADAVSLYHVIKDVLEYLNITTGGTTDLTSTHAASTVTINSSTGTDAIINASTTSLAGVMTASDKTNLEALITLSGVSAASANLGTFSGSIISDNTTVKNALQQLELAIGSPDGNGIYGGSGTIAPNTIATLTNNSVFQIDFVGGNAAIHISDLNEIVTITSPDGFYALSTAPAKAAIEGPSGELAFNASTTIFTDTNSGHGIQYSTDLSSTFQPNSLVTKQYVDDSVTSGLPGGTTAGQILYWNGTDWVLTKQVTNTQTGTISPIIYLPHVPVESLSIDVYLNGVLKEVIQDYTRTTNEIVFSIPIVISDKITTKYYY